MRTGFPGILVRAIPVPSHFVVDTSITFLSHAGNPLENVLSFQRYIVLLWGHCAILVRVHGWGKSITGIPSGRKVCGFRCRCDPVRGHGDVVVSDPEFEYTSISFHNTERTINLVIQFRIAPHLMHFTSKVNPRVSSYVIVLLLHASVEVFLIPRLRLR